MLCRGSLRHHVGDVDVGRRRPPDHRGPLLFLRSPAPLSRTLLAPAGAAVGIWAPRPMKMRTIASLFPYDSGLFAPSDRGRLAPVERKDPVASLCGAAGCPTKLTESRSRSGVVMEPALRLIQGDPLLAAPLPRSWASRAARSARAPVELLCRRDAVLAEEARGTPGTRRN